MTDSSPLTTPRGDGRFNAASTRLDIQLIGGPTVLLEFAGVRFLTDPTFDPPGEHPVGNRTLMKVSGPAVSAETIGAIDVVLLSHDQHPDNLDTVGRQVVAAVPLVLTTEEGAQRLGGTARPLAAWAHVEVQTANGEPVRVTGVPAQHGPDSTEHLTGQVRGFVLEAEGMPTTYVSGDNASIRVVEEVADHVGPVDIALLHAGAARTPLMDAYLTLTAEQTVRAATILNASVVIPVHAEGWSHFTQGTSEVSTAFESQPDPSQLMLLQPGERTSFSIDASRQLVVVEDGPGHPTRKGR